MNDIHSPDLPPLQRYSHAAMATTFAIWIAGETEQVARQAAGAAFGEIDRLEQKLSRFIENSEIAQINRQAGGDWTPVSPETLECLRAGANVAEATGGAFDITIGALLECWRPADGAPRKPAPTEIDAARAVTGINLLQLDEERLLARLDAPGARLDLGAIGKGYTVERAAAVLREFGISAGVINGGGSTIYALGAPVGCEGWPLGAGFGLEEADLGATEADADARRVILKEMALSASGTDVKGQHILDPRTGRPPESGCLRAWALNPSPTVADALSTALMIMDEDEIWKVCRKFCDVGALILRECEGRRVLARYGNW